LHQVPINAKVLNRRCPKKLSKQSTLWLITELNSNTREVGNLWTRKDRLQRGGTD